MIDRARLLISIAAPQFREELDRAAFSHARLRLPTLALNSCLTTFIPFFHWHAGNTLLLISTS